MSHDDERPHRLKFGPAKPLPSTWAVLPAEAAKRPSLVVVTDASGAVIATIDPLTRKRQSVKGQAEGTLSQQGWNARVDYHGQIQRGPPPFVAPARHRDHPDYGAKLSRDRDKRG